MKQSKKRKNKTLLKQTTNLLARRFNLWLNLVREKEEKSSCALTPIDSTTLKTCAITATIVKVRAKWHMHVVILTDLTTQEVCVKTVTYRSTTSKEKTRNKKRILKRIVRLMRRQKSKKSHRSTKLIKRRLPSLTQMTRFEVCLHKVDHQPGHSIKKVDFQISFEYGEATSSFQMGTAHPDFQIYTI